MSLHFPTVKEILEAVRSGESDTIKITAGLNRWELQELIGEIPTLPKLRKLDLWNASLDGYMVGILADAISQRTDIEELNFNKVPLEEAGVRRLAKAMLPNKGMKKLYFSFCDLEEKEIAPLLESVEKLKGLEGLHLNGNEWSQAMHDRIGDTLAQHRNLAALGLMPSTQRPHPNHDDSHFADALLGHPHPNLVTMNGLRAPQINGLLGRNIQLMQENKKTLGMMMSLYEDYAATAKEVTPEQLFHIEGQLAALRHSTSSPNTMIPYETFLRALPQLTKGEPLTLEGLYTRDAEGFTPLENPLTWREHPELLETIAQAGNLDKSDRRTAKGTSLLQAAFEYLPAQDVLTTLNRHGMRIDKAMLLDSDDAPKPLLETLIRKGEVGACFTPENWRGGSMDELKALVRALPEETRQYLPSLHGVLYQLQISPQTAQPRGR